MARSLELGILYSLTFLLIAAASAAETGRVEVARDDQAGQLRVSIDGREALVYCYGADLDLPHYYPVRSPSGRSMTIQHPDPYPHHRSFWFADTVQLAGQRQASIYNSLYSRVDKKDPKSPLRDRSRHVEFLDSDNPAVIRDKLVWEMDQTTPILDELREVRVVPLGEGEYFLDMTFTVTASYGDVTFVSDWVHYAWPFVRMTPEFSVDKGGKIVNSEGGVNQEGTNGKEAVWVDYAGAGGEGLAIFSHPQNEHPHKWLTRDYGCFGPRRIDAKSGNPFTLKKGESMVQRAGVLVHRGDLAGGRVAERYQQYAEGKL